MELNEKQRRMISTYPFKYTYTEPEFYFANDKAALYVHVPFCVKKCHFCTYIALVNSTDDIREQYVQAVCKEIENFNQISCYPKYNIETLYLGGGTPSLLSNEQITRIVKTCKANFNFLPNAEMCIEFDPTSVTDDKLKVVKELGFSRVSVGVQSFKDEVLKAGNRSHNSIEAYKAIELFHKYDFKNFNIDLMYPLQYQSLKDWENDLNEAIRLKPSAITAHVLEVWPKTRMAKLVSEKSYELPSYDEEIKMTNLAYDILEVNGFKRWSNCGYYHPERTNHYCVFMEYYWRTYPMIGFGVSAKSVLGQRVYTNIASFEEYIKRINNNLSPLDFSVKMTKRQEMLRVIIRGLKVCFIDKQLFFEKFGVTLYSIFKNEIDYLLQKGWINDLNDKIELTREGQVYDRSVYSVFYTDEDLKPTKEGEVFYGLSLEV